MKAITKVIFSVIALALGGCVSESAKEYRELQNRRFNDEDAKTRAQQRAAAIFPELVTEMRRAFDSGKAFVTPKLISSVQPKYPKGKAWKEVQGGVWILFIVSEDGSVTQAQAMIDEAMPAEAAFADAAVVAVTQWRFSPATLDGKPLRYYLCVPVLFEVHSGI